MFPNTRLSDSPPLAPAAGPNPLVPFLSNDSVALSLQSLNRASSVVNVEVKRSAQWKLRRTTPPTSHTLVALVLPAPVTLVGLSSQRPYLAGSTGLACLDRRRLPDLPSDLAGRVVLAEWRARRPRWPLSARFTDSSASWAVLGLSPRAPPLPPFPLSAAHFFCFPCVLFCKRRLPVLKRLKRRVSVEIAMSHYPAPRPPGAGPDEMSRRTRSSLQTLILLLFCCVSCCFPVLP